MEAAIHELLWASVALDQTSAELLSQNPSAKRAAIAERLRRGYANLQEALSDAERASVAARSLASRALTASGAARTAAR